MVDQGKIIVFGGGNFDGEIFSDLYSLDLSYMTSSAIKNYSTSSKQEIDNSFQTNSRSSRRRAKKR